MSIKAKQIHALAADANKVLTVGSDGIPVWQDASAASSLLGTPTDGSLTDSRYTGGASPAVGLSTTTKVVDAIDSINEVLGLLLPTGPATLGGQTLTLSGAGSALLASGATDNTGGSIVTAGTTVSRTESTVSTTTLTNVGDGSTGTVTLYANGSAVSGENFTFTGAVGITKSTGVMQISNVAWYPSATPGFFEAFNVAVSGYTGATGYNALQLKHTISGNTTTAYFVKDSLAVAPTVGTITTTEKAKLNDLFSSGVEHYGSGSTLYASSTLTNFVGQTYVSTPISISGSGTTVNNPGLTLPVAANTTTYNVTNQTFTIGTNHHTISYLTVTATNPHGSGSANGATNLLIKSGAAYSDAGKVYEDGFSAKTVYASRVYLSDTTKANDTPSALTNSAWNSSQLLNAVGYTHEATIVGGILKKDTTNYSTGYLPVGPDYSAKNATQYVTYVFSLAAVSNMTINVTGSYTGCWVALPAVSTNGSISPNAINGVWWNAMVAYNGSGVPGRAGDTTAGCASGSVSGGSGNMSVTFGVQSSSNSTSNQIFVRFKLTGSQSITALTIS